MVRLAYLFRRVDGRNARTVSARDGAPNIVDFVAREGNGLREELPEHYAERVHLSSEHPLDASAAVTVYACRRRHRSGTRAGDEGSSLFARMRGHNNKDNDEKDNAQGTYVDALVEGASLEELRRHVRRRARL